MENIGKIEITSNGIVDIVLESVEEVDGVLAIADRIAGNETIKFLKNITKMGKEKSIDVELGETECVIELGLVLEYGHNVRDVVAIFQRVTKENIEKMTGITVREINVKVSNIMKKPLEEEANV